MVFHAIMKFCVSIHFSLAQSTFFKITAIFLSNYKTVMLSYMEASEARPKTLVPLVHWLGSLSASHFYVWKRALTILFSLRVRIRENLFPVVIKYRSLVCQKDQLCGWQFLETWLWRAIGYNLNFQKCHN